MMVYDSDSTHLCSSNSGGPQFRCKLILFFSRDSHVDRHINIIIQYEIKTICLHALGTKCRPNV